MALVESLRLRLLRPAVSISSTLLTLAACGNPCRDLSERICNCTTPVELRARCIARVDTLAAQWNTNSNSPNYASGEQEADGQRQCVQRLQTCSCEALAAGDLQACGLAAEPTAP